MTPLLQRLLCAAALVLAALFAPAAATDSTEAFAIGDKAALRKMKTSELRAALAARGIKCEGCSEKNDYADELFVHQALPTLAPTPAPTPAPAAAEPPPDFNYEDILKKMSAGKDRVARIKKTMAARGMDTSGLDTGVLGSLADSTMDDEKLIELLSTISGISSPGGGFRASSGAPPAADDGAGGVGDAAPAEPVKASKAPKAPKAAPASSTPKTSASKAPKATAASSTPKAAKATPAAYRAGTVDDPKVKAALDKSAARAAARKLRAAKGAAGSSSAEEDGDSPSSAKGSASSSRKSSAKGSAAASGDYDDEDSGNDAGDEAPTPTRVSTPKPTPKKASATPRTRARAVPTAAPPTEDETIDLDSAEGGDEGDEL